MAHVISLRHIYSKSVHHFSDPSPLTSLSSMQQLKNICIACAKIANIMNYVLGLRHLFLTIFCSFHDLSEHCK
jgi:hypothetical protein